jgi:hypothetical protein
MARRETGIDPAGHAAGAALAAFRSARNAGKPAVECYRAGVAAWRRIHPDHSPEYAAKQAVGVILARHARLTIEG